MSSAQAPPSSKRSLFVNIAQGSGLYSLAFLGQRLVSVVMAPIATRFLTTADYGFSDVLEQVSIVLSLLLGGNLAASLGYFYFQSEDPAHRRNVAATTIAGAFLLGVVAAVATLPFASPISRLVFGSDVGANYLRLVSVLFIPSFTAEALFSWLRVENRTVQFVAGSWLRIGAAVMGTLLFVAGLRWGVWGVLATTSFSLALSAVVLGIYAWRQGIVGFDGRLFGRMLQFAFPLGLSGLAMLFVHVGDRFILPHYRPMSDLGLYSIAYKLGMMISVVYASFHTYWSAQAYSIMRRPDARTVLARMFTYVALIVTAAAVVLVLTARPALRIFPAPYRGAAALVPVITLAYVVRAVGDFFRCLFLVEGHPAYEAACNWIGALVCLVGYFTLIPRYGIWGAALATLLAFAVVTTVALTWTYRVRPYSVEGGRLLKLSLATAASLVPHFALQFSATTLQIVWATTLLAVFPLVLWVTGFFTSDETSFAVEMARKLAGRLRGLSPAGASS